MKKFSKYEDRQFLFDIVANKKNSVDVDKFDYIERDAYNLGLRSSYDAHRLLVYSRVVNNEICYHNKEVYNLYEMFHTRYSLFKQIYTHRVGTAIELMIVDALLEASEYLYSIENISNLIIQTDDHLKLSEKIDNPEDYLYLTDNIVHTIEGSKDPELEKARSIVKSIKKRELYKFVDEFLIPPELEKHLNKVIIVTHTFYKRH